MLTKCSFNEKENYYNYNKNLIITEEGIVLTNCVKS